MSEENNQVQVPAGAEGGAPSSGVKNDVTPQTHYADEQGVPYYNRYRELQEKLKGYEGVDLDLYNRAKDLDLDELEEAHQFRTTVFSNPEKAAKVLAILKDEADSAVDPTKSAAQQTPEVKALLQRIEKMEQQFQQQAETEQKRTQAGWMKDYDSSVESSIGQHLKDEAFKDLGGNLSEFEKKAIIKLVDDTFQADASLGKRSKLSLKDVPNIVQGVLQSVLNHRRTALGGMIRKNESPDPSKGGGPEGQPKQKPMTEHERIQAMQNYMRDADAGKVTVA